MRVRVTAIHLLLGVIALCLAKIALFPTDTNGPGLVPSAHAAGGLIEWADGKRIVTASQDGATTYVWDYEGKTHVRRYTLRGEKLMLETFRLEE